MSRHALRLVLLTSSLAAAPAPAVVVADLHAATVVVADQSPDARARGFRNALGQVVVRLTGDPAAPESAPLAPLMRAPQRFVGEYAYATEPPPEPAANAPAAPRVAPPRLLLQVRFEGLALERALREAGRAVMGPERPRTLVWLALDDGPERDLVGAEDADAFVAAAAARALPLAWPLLDGEDRAALVWRDLTALDEGKLLAASVRHPAEAMLAGHVWRAGNRWNGRFLWTSAGDADRFEAAAATLEALAGAAFDRVATSTVARYAVRNAELPNVVEVAVENVIEVADYARVLRYLQGLSPVRAVDLIGAERDLLRVRVTFRGELPTFERILALDPLLGRSEQPPSAGALRFRLVPPTAAPAT